VILQRQAELLEIVLARSPTRCVACLIHSGKKERYENANNGNHYEQLN
jgi:hypothetical protein